MLVRPSVCILWEAGILEYIEDKASPGILSKTQNPKLADSGRAPFVVRARFRFKDFNSHTRTRYPNLCVARRLGCSLQGCAAEFHITDLVGIVFREKDRAAGAIVRCTQ